MDDISSEKIIDKILNSSDLKESTDNNPLILGTDVNNKIYIKDISELPHILVCGNTYTGKTAFLQSVLTFLALTQNPENLRLLIYDNKIVDYCYFKDLQHLLLPIFNTTDYLQDSLLWLCMEADKRLNLFYEKSVKNIDSYNLKAKANLPRIIFIIDDFDNLLEVPNISGLTSILLSNGRQVGIHLILVRSSYNSKRFKEEILSYIPHRICFAVTSKTDTKTILDSYGAEELQIPGEFILKTLNSREKLQTIFISDEEITSALDSIGKYDYSDYYKSNSQLEAIKRRKKSWFREELEAENTLDEMIPEAVEAVFEMKSCSVSLLQRRLKLSYSRAARIVDQLEELGIVGPYNGAAPRRLTISKAGWEDLKKSLYGNKKTKSDSHDETKSLTAYEEKNKAKTIAMPFCSNCGSRVPPNARFCGNCGTPVTYKK